MENDFKTWLEFSATIYDVLPYGAAVEVELLENGEVSRVELRESSGDPSFDKFITQTIVNAAPYSMPEDVELVKSLLHFTYTVKF
jgi:TonB family protein